MIPALVALEITDSIAFTTLPVPMKYMSKVTMNKNNTDTTATADLKLTTPFLLIIRWMQNKLNMYQTTGAFSVVASSINIPISTKHPVTTL